MRWRSSSNTYRLHDPLQEIVRRSLERGRDSKPYDRRMTVAEIVREIGVVGPVALNQAERAVETSRLAVLRHKAPVSENEQAVDRRAWVAQQGNMAVLAERLEHVESGHITIRHDPGALALDRLSDLADGIGRKLVQQRMPATPIRSIGHDIDR